MAKPAEYSDGTLSIKTGWLTETELADWVRLSTTINVVVQEA
jgi:hypothetical protein